MKKFRYQSFAAECKVYKAIVGHLEVAKLWHSDASSGSMTLASQSHKSELFENRLTYLDQKRLQTPPQLTRE